MRSLSIGATGMMAQQLNVDVISNNIANMTTTGYKRRRAEFQDLLYQNQQRMGAPTGDGTLAPAGIQIGLGVKPSSVYRIHSQGSLINTENQLDLAIQGEGVFAVQLPNGDTAYTRTGSFQLSADGVISTSEGYQVQPGITIPPEAIEVAISSSGQVSVRLQGQIAMQPVGQFDIVIFANPVGLEAIGDNLLLETEASGPAIGGAAEDPGFGSVLQGFLESSNVNPVQEITQLIAAQRAYDMNSKVISTSDEMLATVNQLR